MALIDTIPKPPGVSYAWKRKSIKNWDWPDQAKEYQANGWSPVPPERHDGVFMPKGHVGLIEFQGWVLMERKAKETVNG